MQKTLPYIIFILSIVCLIPGVTLPLLTIKATINKQEMLSLATKAIFSPDHQSNLVQNLLQSMLDQINLAGKVEVFESTRSLIGTMNELISHGHIVVGMLIGIFGIFIPVIKICLNLLSSLVYTEDRGMSLLKVSGWLSKWSMSDVFVMAILVAFLATNANEHAIQAIQMQATLGSGFYFFTAYCLLAIAANQLLEKRLTQVCTDSLNGRIE